MPAANFNDKSIGSHDTTEEEDPTENKVVEPRDHLFTINKDNPENLSKEGTIMLHHVTENMLYLAKRARPELQLGVNFLCTRMKGPDKDDWKKLTRLMRYILSTIGIPLILGIDDTSTLHFYVDAAFGVHRDMKSRTGIMTTMGQGTASSNSIKRKFNTKISTEADLVGIDDEISLIICSGYFLA